jgi:hypothetical protein
VAVHYSVQQSNPLVDSSDGGSFGLDEALNYGKAGLTCSSHRHRRLVPRINVGVATLDRHGPGIETGGRTLNLWACDRESD